MKTTDMKFHFDHFNINVSDLARSKKFYEQALGMEQVGQIDGPAGSFTIIYMSIPGESFRLELTRLADHPGAYELGENESHLAMRVDGDSYDEVYRRHKEMGIVCFENPAMGIYFIHDPDDYWIEILPPKK